MRRSVVLRGIVTAAVLALGMLMPGRAGAQTGRLFGAQGSNGRHATLYSIDPVTGAAVAIGPVTVGTIGVPITGLAVQPQTGTLYAVTAAGGSLPGVLLIVDKTTGTAINVGSLGIAPTNCGTTAGIVGDIAFSASGTLYGAGPCDPSKQGNLYTIDLATGAATLVGAIPHGSSSRTGFGLTFLPPQGSMQQLFVFPEVVQSNLYQIDPASGGILNTIALSGGISDDAINSATTDPSGTRVLGVMSDKSGSPTTNSLVSVDPSTGVITTINTLPGDMDALALDVGVAQRAPAPLLSPFSVSGRAFGLGLGTLLLLAGAVLSRRAVN